MTRCFVCNRIKEEEGWWGVYLSHHFAPEMSFSLTIVALAYLRGVEDSSYKPACGNNCAQKIVERWLTTGSMDAPRAVEVSA